MTPSKVLVTGATGDTGGYAIELLLERGHEVRALAHRRDDRSKRLEERGVEMVFGDFLNMDEMRAALRGVQRAYFCYPIRPGIIQATAYFAQAAKEAGVDGVVNMAQVSARGIRRVTPRGITGWPSGFSTGRGSRSLISGRRSSPSGCSISPR
jgi:NAD(P)H dehydrogenase (quinone)